MAPSAKVSQGKPSVEPGPPEQPKTYRVVVYVRREEVEQGRIRGYVHPVAMGAGLMAANGERKWFAGETIGQAATRLDREEWVPLVAELRFVGRVRSSTTTVSDGKTVTTMVNGPRRLSHEE